ncbi:MAG: hypothetical protein ACFFDB_14680 [Promethearchaeota archaeon]
MEVTNESLIYLTYKNNSIIKAEYSNQTEIFWTKFGFGYWYLNFTQIPYTLSDYYTIALNDSILVRMNLEYHFSCGFACFGDVRMEQYLCFNSKIEMNFIYFPIPDHSIT